MFEKQNKKASRFKTGNLTGLPREASAKWGFTFIELSIVIVIIGVLTTMVAVALRSVNTKARDVQRLADVRQMQTALERYATNEGSYPTTLTPGNALIGAVTGRTYLDKIPTNPTPWVEGACNISTNYTYTISNSGTYTLTYCLAQNTSDATAGYYKAFPGIAGVSYNPCTPNCSGKTCGDDGCGSSCGPDCDAGLSCVNGNCACVPDCSGKICGDDGCGSICGACTAGNNPIQICSSSNCITDPYTVLMLHMNGSNNGTTFTDFAGSPKTISGSSVVTSTSTSVFGTASAYFTSSGSCWLSTANNDDFNFGTGDFTIDFWVKWTNFRWTSGTRYLNILYRYVSTNGFFLQAYTTDGVTATMRLITYNSTASPTSRSVYLNANGIALNQWYHIAIVRESDTLKGYADGVLRGITTGLSGYAVGSTTQTMYIGTNSATTDQFRAGYLDEIRISKGIARWTATFTPPTAEY